MATSVGLVREGQVLVCIGAVTDVVATLVGIGIQFGSAQADIVAPEASAVPCPTFADVGADVVTFDDICRIPVQPYSREAVIARKVKRERDVALEKTEHMRGEAEAEVEYDAGNSVKEADDEGSNFEQEGDKPAACSPADLGQEATDGAPEWSSETGARSQERLEQEPTLGDVLRARVARMASSRLAADAPERRPAGRASSQD